MNDTRTPATHLVEIVKPTLSAGDIIVFKDPHSESDPGAIEQVGYNIPLIKLNDFLVSHDMIENCTLRIGEQFLTEINITINDDKYKLRELLSSEEVIITANFGTTKDPFFIKQEFILNNVSGIASEPIIYLSGYLNLEFLYTPEIEFYEDKTVFKIIEEICIDTGLGLLTNMEDTDDEQTWLRDDKTLLQFINMLITHAWVGSDTYIDCFIDQYYYLNLIDVNKAFSNRSPEISEHNPVNWSALEKPYPVKLSNSKWDIENFFKIQSWSINLEFGSNTRSIPKVLSRQEIDIVSNNFEIIETEDDIWPEQRLDKKRYQIEKYDSCHDNYLLSKRDKPIIANYLKQGDTITVNTFTPIMLLYPYQYVPVELFIRDSTERLEDQKASGLDELFDERWDRSASKLEKKDNLHSGDYIIRSISLNIDSYTGRTQQIVNLQRLLLKPADIQQIIDSIKKR